MVGGMVTAVLAGVVPRGPLRSWIGLVRYLKSNLSLSLLLSCTHHSDKVFRTMNLVTEDEDEEEGQLCEYN